MTTMIVSQTCRRVSIALAFAIAIPGCADLPPERQSNRQSQHYSAPNAPPQSTAYGQDGDYTRSDAETSQNPTADPIVSSPQVARIRSFRNEGLKYVLTVNLAISGNEISGSLQETDYENETQRAKFAGSTSDGMNLVITMDDNARSNFLFADGARPGTCSWRLNAAKDKLTIPMKNSGRDQSGHDVYRAEFDLVP